MKTRTLTIRICIDNDAFEPKPEPEVAAILTDLAQRIEWGKNMFRPLNDRNGNTVGSVKLTSRKVSS